MRKKGRDLVKRASLSAAVSAGPGVDLFKDIEIGLAGRTGLARWCGVRVSFHRSILSYRGKVMGGAIGRQLMAPPFCFLRHD